MPEPTANRNDHDEGLRVLELYSYLLGNCAARNYVNELVRIMYRNQPVKLRPDDEPSIQMVINKVQSVTHNIVKFMSNKPEVRVPLPYDMSDKMNRSEAIKRERILEQWYKENRFPLLYDWVNMNLTKFGYQPIRLHLNPDYRTKIQIRLDDVDATVGRFKDGQGPRLDFYATAVRMTGDQIHRDWLKGGVGIPLKAKPKDHKGITNTWRDSFSVVFAIDEEFFWIICKDPAVLLKKWKHNLDKVPARFIQNIPNQHTVEGISDVAHILGLNSYINTMLTYALEYLDYQTNPIAFGKFLPRGSTLKDIIGDTGIINVDDAQGDFKFVELPQLPREYGENMKMLTNAIEEQTSMTEFAATGRTDMKRIDAGTTVASLNIGVEALLHLKRDQIKCYLEDMNSMYLEWVDRVYRPEIFGNNAIIKVDSPFKEMGFEYSGADIDGNYDNEVVFIEGQFDMLAKQNSVIQQVEQELMSKRTAMRHLKTTRPEAEQEQIRIEKWENLRYEQALKMIETGQMPPGQGMPQMGGGGGMPGMEGAIPATATEMPGQGALPPPAQGMQGMDMGMGGMGGGMPPEAGMGGGEAPMQSMNLNEDTDMMIEEVQAKIDKLTNLKGQVVVMNVVEGRIMIAIQNKLDKKTIIDALPEYKGMIEFTDLEGINNVV